MMATDGDTVEHGIGDAREAPDEFGGDADAGEAGGSCIALSGVDTGQLIAGTDIDDEGGAHKGLADLHPLAPGVGKDVFYTFSLEGFHEDVAALSGLGVGEDVNNVERPAAPEGGGGGSMGIRGEGECKFGKWDFEFGVGEGNGGVEGGVSSGCCHFLREREREKNMSQLVCVGFLRGANSRLLAVNLVFPKPAV